MFKRRHYKFRIPEVFQSYRNYIAKSPGKEETWSDILETKKLNLTF